MTHLIFLKDLVKKSLHFGQKMMTVDDGGGQNLQNRDDVINV